MAAVVKGFRRLLFGEGIRLFEGMGPEHIELTGEHKGCCLPKGHTPQVSCREVIGMADFSAVKPKFAEATS